MKKNGKLKVFITGASSGIGEALAHEYATQDTILGLVARRKDPLLILKKRLEIVERKLEKKNKSKKTKKVKKS